ncbi:TniB family NTP-binding protein [Ferruginivarius sediminum]|uniref:NACHT domain-containing protein n=1 Tax=Ferruginivarius sediminum TaxID=2661937 RepID=A0A369T6V1_9PROT|nr:TniB family NTP-binding protein [Ferruginivarius sediminum]RDD60612.1 NACHT domain-containing protein [Ferruginivarius sediminum]
MDETTIRDRIRKIDELSLSYDQVNLALDALEDVLAYGTVGAEAKCAMLVGPSGSGKTWALQHFKEGQEAHGSEERDHIPIVYLTAPVQASDKALPGKLLAKLGDPMPEKGTRERMTERLIERLKALGTRMVIIDEVHHLVDSRQNDNKKIRQTAEWLKDMLLAGVCPFVYAGLDTSESLLTTNEQLARRGMHYVRMGAFEYRTKQQREFFAELVETFFDEADLPLEIDRQDLVPTVHEATGGLIGRVATLVQRTIMTAGRQGRACIDAKCLADSWATSGLAMMGQRNPFVRRDGPSGPTKKAA